MAGQKTKRLIGSPLPITPSFIERRIYLIRGQKVMLDSDLAELYQTPTKSLNLAVRRNINRFPSDFMFQLTESEYKNLRFQFETSSYGGRRYLPYAFTEQGVAMLSSVLNSERAIDVNIAIMRTFVRLRQILSSHKDILTEIKKLKAEQRYQRKEIKRVFGIIETLLKRPKAKTISLPEKRPIGFRTN